MSHRLCMIIQKEIEKGINKKENVFELINNKSMSFEMKNGCFLYHTWILIQRLKSENFHWRIFSRSSTGIVYFPFQEFELKCLNIHISMGIVNNTLSPMDDLFSIFLLSIFLVPKQH